MSAENPTYSEQVIYYEKQAKNYYHCCVRHCCRSHSRWCGSRLLLYAPREDGSKVLTAVYSVDNAEIQRRREAIDNRTFDTYMRERCDGAVTDKCTEGMIAACALYYGATPAKVESIKFSPIDKATSDTASFQYTAVFDDDSDVKERIGHVMMKKENGKWCVDSFVTKSVTKAD